MCAAGLGKPDHSHYPYARHVHIGWSRDPLGQWVSATEDESQWEVVCPQCGDTDGPAEGQSKSVRTLRGPYPNKRKAQRVVRQHGKHNREDHPWGGFPAENFPMKP